jgi:hypothetical protein
MGTGLDRFAPDSAVWFSTHGGLVEGIPAGLDPMPLPFGHSGRRALETTRLI